MAASLSPAYPWRPTRTTVGNPNGAVIVGGIAGYRLIVDAFVLQGQSIVAHAWSLDDTAGVVLMGAVQQLGGTDPPVVMENRSMRFACSPGAGLRVIIGGGGNLSGYVLTHYEAVG